MTLIWISWLSNLCMAKKSRFDFGQPDLGRSFPCKQNMPEYFLQRKDDKRRVHLNGALSGRNLSLNWEYKIATPKMRALWKISSVCLRTERKNHVFLVSTDCVRSCSWNGSDLKSSRVTWIPCLGQYLTA